MLCIFPTKILLCFPNVIQMSVIILPLCLLKQWKQWKLKTMASFQGAIKNGVFEVHMFNCSRLLFSLSPLLSHNIQGKYGLFCPTDIGFDCVLLRPMECGWKWQCHCCLISFRHLTLLAFTYLKWCLLLKETVHLSASVSGRFFLHCEKDFPPSSFSLFSLSPKVRLMEQNCPNEPANSEWPQPTCRLWLMKINYCDCKSLNCIIMQHDCVNS